MVFEIVSPVESVYKQNNPAGPGRRVNSSVRQIYSTFKMLRMNNCYQKSDVTSGIVRWSIRELLELITFIPFLFWPAGAWNWPMAWALIGLGVLRAVGTVIVVVPRYPELFAERVGVRQGSKAWDVAIISIIRVMLLAMMIIAGLDVRFAWTIKLPFWANMAGMVVALAGHGLYVWAIGSNAYFARYVRIQGE